MNPKTSVFSLTLVLVSFIAFVSCEKDSSIDLSQRFGNWTVIQSNDPLSEGAVAVPDENGIFAVGDKIEYGSGASGTERICLKRTIKINGNSIPYEVYFVCTLDGNKLTLHEELYGEGASHSLRLSYLILSLTKGDFTLKRADLGKNEGIVTLRR